MTRRLLIEVVRPEAPRIIAGALSGLLCGSAQLLFPQMIGLVLDTRSLSTAFALLISVLLFAEGLGRFGEKFFFDTASQVCVARLRQVAFDSLLRQEISFFDAQRTGDLTSRLMNDAHALEKVLMDEVGSATRAMVIALGGFTVLLWTSPVLTVAMVAALVPLVVFLSVVGKRVGQLMRSYQERIGDVASVAVEATSGIRAIREADQQEFASKRFAEAGARVLEIGRRHNVVYGLVRGVASIGSEMTALLLLFVALPLATSGSLTAGGIAAFVFTGLMAMNAVRDIAVCASELRRIAGALERVLEVIEREPLIPMGTGVPGPPILGHIHFENVRFAYPSRREIPALDGLDLSVGRGDIVALVGASGAGKSTLVSLLLRFHDPDSGRVLIDGVDTRDLDGRWLRRHVGLVAQEPRLFAMTVEENIRFGLGIDQVSTADVHAAAKTANALEFIGTLKDGFATGVGDRGVQLSGGQRQRIAIARTVLKNPKILILDEATSALDSESESLVHEALERLMKGRTTLVIAHRLSTILAADRVVLIEAGRVAASGTHDALMATSASYASLVKAQIVAA